MAKFNEEIFNVEALTDSDKKIVGIYLQALITTEELKQLKEDWKSIGGYEKIPYWKFCLENIDVSYKGKEN